MNRSNFSFSNRRDFLKAAAGFAFVSPFVVQPMQISAAEKRAAWVIASRDSHLKIVGKPDCWSCMKDMGVEGVEVGVNEDLKCPGLHHPTKKYEVGTIDGVKQLQDDITGQGLVVSCLCMSNRFDERLDKELAMLEKVLKAAELLKVKPIRIDVVPRAIPGDKFLPYAVKICRQMCDMIKGTPFQLAIENHGSKTNDPAFLDPLFAEVGSKQLGLTLDPNNFYWFGHTLDEVYQIIEKYASRSFHTHIKNIGYPEEKRQVRRPMGWQYDKYTCPVYDGDIDYKRVAKILLNTGYQGDLCLENECLGRFPKDQHAAIVKKEIATMKALL